MQISHSSQQLFKAGLLFHWHTGKWRWNYLIYRASKLEEEAKAAVQHVAIKLSPQRPAVAEQCCFFSSCCRQMKLKAFWLNPDRWEKHSPSGSRGCSLNLFECQESILCQGHFFLLSSTWSLFWVERARSTHWFQLLFPALNFGTFSSRAAGKKWLHSSPA